MKKFLLFLLVFGIAISLIGCLGGLENNNESNKPEIVSETYDYTVYKIHDGDNVCYWIETNNNPFPSHNDPLPIIRCVLSINDDGTIP